MRSVGSLSERARLERFDCLSDTDSVEGSRRSPAKPTALGLSAAFSAFRSFLGLRKVLSFPGSKAASRAPLASNLLVWCSGAGLVLVARAKRRSKSCESTREIGSLLESFDAARLRSASCSARASLLLTSGDGPLKMVIGVSGICSPSSGNGPLLDCGGLPSNKGDSRTTSLLDFRGISGEEDRDRASALRSRISSKRAVATALLDRDSISRALISSSLVFVRPNGRLCGECASILPELLLWLEESSVIGGSGGSSGYFRAASSSRARISSSLVFR